MQRHSGTNKVSKLGITSRRGQIVIEILVLTASLILIFIAILTTQETTYKKIKNFQFHTEHRNKWKQ